jgi:transcriptional regulator with XRE-family HTH domain
LIFYSPEEYSNFEYSKSEYIVASMKKQRLAGLLRQTRFEANLTQEQVAEIIGQTQSYVSKYENGEQRLDLIELEAVCTAVGIPLTEFVRRYLEA